MNREIRIYVEGGGDNDSKADLRNGFEIFLGEMRSLAAKRRIRLNIVACGGRDSAFDDFRIALETKEPSSYVILLVDSESPVAHENPWEHLIKEDGWNCGFYESTLCHFMVQTMETWIIADAEKLAEYYGKGFRMDALPTHELESIRKYNLYKALIKSSKKTVRGRYHKTQHAPSLLGLIRTSIVREKASYCERLFQTLHALIHDEKSGE
jgi:hypothetical protein